MRKAFRVLNLKGFFVFGDPIVLECVSSIMSTWISEEILKSTLRIKPKGERLK